MTKYRIYYNDGCYTIQKRFLFFFWYSPSKYSDGSGTFWYLNKADAIENIQTVKHILANREVENKRVGAVGYYG